MPPSSSSDTTIYDLVVIGGGLSGLSAACYHHQHQPDAKLLVLEARDRVGGRTYTKTVEITDPATNKTFSHALDFGGAYVGPSQNRVLRVAKQHNIKTHRINTEGETVMQMLGKTYRYSGTVPYSISPISLLDTNTLMVQTEKLRKQIDLHKPWNSPHAKELDNISVAEWVKQNTWTELAATIYHGAIRGLLCVEMHSVSMLAWLFYVHSADGINRISEVDNGAQERHFVGGSQQLSEALMRSLPENTVKLDSPIAHVDRSDSQRMVITTKHGQTYTARNMIIAMAPSLYGRIDFTPALPPLKQQLTQRMPVGSIIKVHIAYSTAFWRFEYNGTLFSDFGPASYTYDNCSGQYTGLMCFLYSDVVTNLRQLSREQRRDLICKQLAAAFNNDAALQPIAYHEMDWNQEPYSGGCYVGTLPPGVLTTLGQQLTEPTDSIHYAGSESAVHWTGYMSGAVESGERTAHEVLRKEGHVDHSFQYNEPIDHSHEVMYKPNEVDTYQYYLPSVTQLLATGAVAAGLAMWRYRHILLR